MCAYPLSLINTFVSAGLVFLHLPESIFPLRAKYDWKPPFRAWTPVVVFFFLSNVFLVCAPLVPPAPGYKVYDQLPYWVSTYFSQGQDEAQSYISLFPVSCMSSWHVQFPLLVSYTGMYALSSFRDEAGTSSSGSWFVKMTALPGTYSEE